MYVLILTTSKKLSSNGSNNKVRTNMLIIDFIFAIYSIWISFFPSFSDEYVFVGCDNEYCEELDTLQKKLSKYAPLSVARKNIPEINPNMKEKNTLTWIFSRLKLKFIFDCVKIKSILLFITSQAAS